MEVFEQGTKVLKKWYQSVGGSNRLGKHMAQSDAKSWDVSLTE